MTILDKIVAHKKIEVANRKQQRTIKDLEAMPNFGLRPVSLSQLLIEPDGTGIIAEFKRKSPSKGIINGRAIPEKIGAGYEEAGATGMSILTDNHFFAGTEDDLMAVREAVKMPLLRKDFVVDEYQIVEAKAIGADVILLIASCLEKAEIKSLTKVARSLGLDVLLEIHEKEELKKFYDGVTIVGVNNRNLKTFEVTVETSLNMLSELPDSVARISESGISVPRNVAMLKRAGYDGFLIGESFMKTDNPSAMCKKFIDEMKEILAAPMNYF